MFRRRGGVTWQSGWAEADSWTVVDRNKYNEITTRQGGVAGNDPQAADPVWAVGWHHRSLLLNVRDAARGEWTCYRLPRGHAAFDTATPAGWRRGLREVLTERAVMNIHGTFYEVPRDNSGGMRRIRPVSTHDRDIHDYVFWRGMLVLSGNLLGAADDPRFVASEDGKVGLWFGNVDDLWRFGPPRGEGGPWLQTAVRAGEASDPYLMYGYSPKRLQLSHEGGGDVSFILQVDILRDNRWSDFQQFEVAAGEQLDYTFPEGYSAHRVRLIAEADVTATAQFHYDP